jgi:hypothetical protein
METQEAKEISDSMSRIQAKGKDEKRESTSGPYDSLYLMDNDAIPDTPRRQTENVSTNGSEIGSSSPWAPLPRAFLTPQQYARSLIMPRSAWASTQTAPDLAGEFTPIPSFRQLAMHSIVNPPEKDEVLKSKLHHSSSGEDSIEPTRRGVPGPPKFEEVSQFLEATPTTTQENANEGSWKPMRSLAWPTHGYPIPPVLSSTSTNPFISSPRHSLGHNPTPSPRGYYRIDYPPYSPPFGNDYSFATPSPSYMDVTERRESPTEGYRCAPSRRGFTPLPRPTTIKRTPRYPSEGIDSTSYDGPVKQRSAWAERSAQERREIRRYDTFYYRYYTIERPKGPKWYELWSEKYVPKETEDIQFQYQDPPQTDLGTETEDVQFQYQDPPQTLSKPQDNGANSRGRILAQRRKKRSPGKKTQHSPLDSSLDLSASAEKLSREDESPSRTEPQLIGRHKLSDWKLHNGISKDWRRKPSAKALTARQFLTAIYSHKQLHYSTVHAEGPGMAGFDPDIPVAAQRSRRGKTSMAVRNEFPAFLSWLDRKGFRDMGMKRDYMRDIFDEEEFEAEAHRKLGL